MSTLALDRQQMIDKWVRLEAVDLFFMRLRDASSWPEELCELVESDLSVRELEEERERLLGELWPTPEGPDLDAASSRAELLCARTFALAAGSADVFAAEASHFIADNGGK
jgi:hypothetical protein